MSNAVLLVSRIFLVILFITGGFGFAANPGGIAGWFGSIGVPLPSVTVWLVILVKVVGGAFVLVGYQTRYSSYAIAAFCVGAALIAHNNFADQNEMTQFLKDLAIAGGFLALSVSGPGAFSVDARRGAAPAYA
jgi:putative oxidoreductase